MGEEGLASPSDERGFRIRQFRPEDAPHLGLIFHRAIREIARRVYSQEQVEAWGAFPLPAELYLEKAQDGRLLLVAADAHDQPVAYGDIEPDGHVDHLFCLPEHTGTGKASSLYRRLEDQARIWMLTRLFVEASESARPFFERKGFVQVRRNEIIRRDVALHNYSMEKLLA